MLTLPHKVEEKCAGHRRGGPLRYVKSDFGERSVQLSRLRESSVPVHLAGIDQERE